METIGRVWDAMQHVGGFWEVVGSRVGTCSAGFEAYLESQVAHKYIQL